MLRGFGKHCCSAAKSRRLWKNCCAALAARHPSCEVSSPSSGTAMSTASCGRSDASAWQTRGLAEGLTALTWRFGRSLAAGPGAVGGGRKSGLSSGASGVDMLAAQMEALRNALAERDAELKALRSENLEYRSQVLASEQDVNALMAGLTSTASRTRCVSSERTWRVVCLFTHWFAYVNAYERMLYAPCAQVASCFFKLARAAGTRTSQ